MNSVRHLLRSQIFALRWWLLAWAAALAAWDIGRWTYLNEFRETWAAREQAYLIALLSFSALLTAALVHLHPTARRTAAWRAWPLRPWKMAAAQILFVLLFLVLLPGAMEAAFLSHPKLDGFMGEGMRQWFLRSLWPLPIALGLASCSTSLRRFLLDAIVLAAVLFASVRLGSTSVGMTLLHSRNGNWSYLLLPWFLSGLLLLPWLHWVFGTLSGRSFHRFARAMMILIPALWIGCSALLNRVLPGPLRMWYAQTQLPPARDDVTARINVSIHPGTIAVSEKYSGLPNQLTAATELTGLEHNEYAEIYFSDLAMVRDKNPILEETLPDWLAGRSGGTFGNAYWTPFSAVSAESAKPLSLGHTIM